MLTKHVLMAVAILMICLPPAAAAQQPDNPCANPQTQIELNACSDFQFRKADAALNKTYERLMARLDSERKEKLKQAERAWLKFRDADCDLDSYVNKGGSIYPMVYSDCLTLHTKTRTQELEQKLQSEDGR